MKFAIHGIAMAGERMANHNHMAAKRAGVNITKIKQVVRCKLPQPNVSLLSLNVLGISVMQEQIIPK